MAKLDIVIAPDPVLKKKTAAVAAVDGDVARLMEDMLETMYAAPGIGLAAPQVGLLRQVLVMDVAGKEEEPQPICMANPRVVWESEFANTHEEGCLSLPEQYAEVTRPAEVKVRYLDQKGTEQQLHAKGLLATCVQHEIDHLGGILFVDHLSALRRSIILRKLTKWKRAQAA